MTAPALGLVARPYRAPEPRTPGWGALLVAVAVTLLLGIFMASGLVVRSGWILPDRSPAAPQTERVTWVDVPPTPLPAPADPTVAGIPDAGRAAVPRAAPGLPNAPAVPGVPSPTRPVVPPFPVAPVAPSSPVARDTASGAAPSVDARRTSPLAPQVVIPNRLPGATLPPPPSAGDRLRPNVTCAAPCAGAERVGVGVGGRDLTAEERAEALRALGRSVPAMAGAMGKPHAAPAPVPEAKPTLGPGMIEGGVTLRTGLPWGGPTKAERERDARLRTEYAAILAKIRTRAESLAVIDSLERARTGQPARPPR